MRRKETALIREILPTCVAAAERYDDPPGTVLFPAEEALLARAVAKRRAEFTTGRLCARQALAELGVEPVPVLPDERRAPQWPPGIVGSITHCTGYRAAVVARAGDVATVGVDAEPNLVLPEGVFDSVSLSEERSWVRARSAADPAVHWDRLVFSAKESVYKAWYPLTRQWLGFEQALVTVEPAEQVFTARLLVPGPQVGARELTGFTGRWLVRDGLVLTAVVVPAVYRPG